MCRLRLITKQSESQRARKSNEVMIMASYSHQSKTTLFYSKKSIDGKYWDKKNQCIKRSYAGHSKFNLYLSKFRQKIDDIINSALADDVNPTTVYVKDIYNGRKLDTKDKKTMSFWGFTDDYIDKAQVRLSKNTIKSYKTIVKNIKGYERHARLKIDWHNIDMDFYHDYMDYYIGYKQLKVNGFGKVIKLLKTILNSATELGYNTNTIYKSKGFKVLDEKADSIYLNEDELKSIIDLDLSENKNMKRVRDLFIMGCYTGLRFSDYSQISLENIKGDFLNIKTQKTGTTVVIPLLNEVKLILDSYNGNLPKPMTNQVMNRYLKEIGQLAGITNSFNTHHTTGSGRVKQTFKKWELICTHTARRSYATNMYKRGLDPIMIMQVTGHSNEKVFLNYIKISKKENAKRMLEFLNQDK